MLRRPIVALALALFATSASGAELTGPMKSYAWFPGRWACRTASAGTAKEPAPAKLWVVVDPRNGTLRQSFSTTDAQGRAYRSDDVLGYDPKLHGFVRRTIDVHGAQIALMAKAPYKSSMDYVGLVGLQNGKIYRMRATVAIDAAHTLMTTATAFYHADKKSWVVQSTGACSKVSN